MNTAFPKKLPTSHTHPCPPFLPSFPCSPESWRGGGSIGACWWGVLFSKTCREVAVPNRPTAGTSPSSGSEEVNVFYYQLCALAPSLGKQGGTSLAILLPRETGELYNPLLPAIFNSPANLALPKTCPGKHGSWQLICT